MLTTISTLSEYGILKGTRHLFPFSKLRNQILTSHQLYRMRRLVKYAYKNSPFYREFYIQHGIKEKDLDSLEFQDLPIVTKKEITEHKGNVFTDPTLNYDEIYNFIYDKSADTKLFKNKYRCLTTSGSLGKQTVIVYSHTEWNNTLAMIAVDPLYLPKFGKDHRIRIAGILRTAGTSAGSLLFRALPSRYYNAKEISVLAPIDNIIDELNQFNPEHIASYPGLFLSLLPHKKNGKLKISPKTIRLGGEILTVEDQKEISDVFNAEVLNGYGSSECLIIGMKKTGEPCFNIASQYAHLEILNENNEQVAPGEVGNVIVTNLWNYTQPFIRYALGDRAVYHINERGEPAIKEIVSRNYKPIYFTTNTKKQSYFHPFALYEMLLYVPGIEKSQLLLGDNKITARMIGSEQGIMNASNKFKDFLTTNQLDQNVDFVIQPMENLTPEANGKIPFIKYETTAIT